MVYDGKADLKFDKNLKTIRKELTVDTGGFVFDPDSFKEQAKSFSLESHRLTEEVLRQYGDLATLLRQRLKDSAIALRAEVDMGDANDRGDDVQLPAHIARLNRGCKKDRSVGLDPKHQPQFLDGYRPR